MRGARDWYAAVGLLGLLGCPGRAEAQAIGFAPQPASISDGVSLSATPAVSADRRYVRLSLGVGFQTVDGFQTFPVPAAVGGGGGGGGLGMGGRGGGPGGGFGGLNGPAGAGQPGAAGLASPMGPDVAGSSHSEGPLDPGSGASRSKARRPRVARSRTVGPKKDYPDPTVTASKARP